MRRAGAWIAAGVLALALAGCGSSSTADSSSTSPTPTPTPTPASVVWAGEVCQSMDRVKASVGALGRNLSYDVTSDRSALDQIQRQLTLQVLALGDAASALQASLTQVPVDFTAANDMVATLTKSGQDTKDAAAQVQQHLSAAASGGDVITIVAEVGQAIVAAKAAYEAGQAFVSAIGSATSTAQGELKDAFDAAPACQGS